MNVLDYLIIFIGLILDFLFVYNDKKYKNKLSIYLKTLASLMFVILGFRLYKGNGLLVLIALCFDMLGDFILILRNKHKQFSDLVFAIGTISFFIAHILLSSYLIGINNTHLLQSMIINIVLYTCIVAFFQKTLNVHGKMKMLGACYLFIIMFTNGLVITNYFYCRNLSNLLLLIALLLFICSDLVLMYYKYGRYSKKSLQIIYRFVYYISQILLALYIGII